MKKRYKSGDDWGTPRAFYDALDAEFRFDFDPCPLRPRFDGLQVEWGGSSFVNPPYSRELKGAFVAKGVEQAAKGRRVVLLLPCSMSTALFHDVILPNAREIRFPRGRLAFSGTNTFGKKVDSVKAMHDSMVVVLRKPGEARIGIVDRHEEA